MGTKGSKKQEGAATIGGPATPVPTIKMAGPQSRVIVNESERAAWEARGYQFVAKVRFPRRDKKPASKSNETKGTQADGNRWPDQEARRWPIRGDRFIAYPERVFDPLWGMDRWGYRIEGRREKSGPIDRITLTGTGWGRLLTYSENIRHGDTWKLPVGLTTKEPFSKGGEKLLCALSMGEIEDGGFAPMPEAIRGALVSTCGISPDHLRNLTGPQVASVIERHKEKLGWQEPKLRKRRHEKIAAIAAFMEPRPHATSSQVADATGIPASEVRNLWGPIKKRLRKPKGDKPKGHKTDDGRIEAVDDSAICHTCEIPLGAPFECRECGQIIKGECKTCHYTNTHPEKAIP